MEPNPTTDPLAPDLKPLSPEVGRPTVVQRLVAALEVILCSDYPTQAALTATFAALGFGPFGRTVNCGWTSW